MEGKKKASRIFRLGRCSSAVEGWLAGSGAEEELYGVVETSSPIRQLARHCPHQYPSSSESGRCPQTTNQKPA